MLIGRENDRFVDDSVTFYEEDKTGSDDSRIELLLLTRPARVMSDSGYIRNELTIGNSYIINCEGRYMFFNYNYDRVPANAVCT